MHEPLIQAIREAFPTEPLPPRPVTEHRCSECDEVDSQLGDRPWPAVADPLPDYCHDAFPLLSSAAKVYYLPAFLVDALRRPGYMSGESVKFALERGDLTAEEFTPLQWAVIDRWARAYSGSG
jgi:hypothetical protein